LRFQARDRISIILITVDGFNLYPRELARQFELYYKQATHFWIAATEERVHVPY
jgi:hypothetical protein